MLTETLELVLLNALKKAINAKLGDATRHLAQGAWETTGEAKKLVGYIQACTELEDEFYRIVKEFYPDSV